MRLNKLLVPLAFSMLFSSGVAVAASHTAIDRLANHIGYTPSITNYTKTFNGAVHHVTVAFKDLRSLARLRCVIRMNGKVVGMAEETIKGVGTLDIFISGGTPDATEAECEVLTRYH